MNGTGAVYSFDDVRVDTVAARVFKGESPVALEPRAFELLCFLVRNPGRLVEKQELMDSVWADAAVSDNAVSRAVAHLRRALGDDAREARYLETVPTRGYRFVARVDSRPEPARPSPADGARRLASRRGWVLLAAGALAGAGATWALGPSPTTATPRPRRLAVTLGPERLVPGHLDTLALSPDGRLVAFVGVAESGADETAAFLRDLETGVTQRVAGSENADGLFLSPDGRELGFFADRTLYRVPVDGGPPAAVTGRLERSPRGASFATDRSAVFTTSGRDVVRIGRDGTTSVVARPEPENGESALVLPRPVPGRDALVVTVMTSDAPEDARVDLVDLATGSRRPLLPRGFDARATADRVLFTWNGGLLAARVDWQAGRLLGEPFTVLEGVLSSGKGVALYAASDDSLVFLPRAGEVSWRLYWVDREGTKRPALDASSWVSDPAVAPDGTHFAFRRTRDRDAGVWIHEREGRGMRRLEIDGAAAALVWAPDGDRLAYGVRSSETGSGYDVFWKGLAAGDAAEPLAETPPWEFPKSFFPDGPRLVYEVQRDWHDRDIWVVDPRDDRREPLIATPSDEREPAVSPDGRWVAFQSDRTGRYEVYVADATDTTRMWQVSRDGGREPLWTRGGAELVYRQGAGVLHVDADTSAATPRFGDPVLLFEEPMLQPGPGYRNFSALPDGSEFLIVGAEGIPPPDVIEVVLSWPALEEG